MDIQTQDTQNQLYQQIHSAKATHTAYISSLVQLFRIIVHYEFIHMYNNAS